MRPFNPAQVSPVNERPYDFGVRVLDLRDVSERELTAKAEKERKDQAPGKE